MKFFESYIGMFITQSVLHSFITVIIIEMVFYSWEIKDHLIKFRYRLLVLILPIFMFPTYQLLNPDRGTMYFRENTAIFDINKWLAIRLWDVIPLYALFLLFLFLAVIIFVLQEILPTVMEKVTKSGYQLYSTPDISTDIDAIIDNICKKLRIEKPAVQIVDEPYPMLFTTGVKNHTIIISKSLLDKLDDEQLESVLVHEVMHIMRGSSIKTQIIYLLRMLMFYNPVSLIEFRRLVQDEEFICDDLTVSLTKKPDALISALMVFYSYPKEDKISNISMVKDIIESHSHNLLLKERIMWLKERRIADSPGFGWVKYIFTIIVIIIINYMVV